MIFSNRTEAGIKLTQALSKYKDQKGVIVLGLPRGGIPVAYEVAKGLNADMDVFVVRKVGAPYNEEFAIGAVAQDGGVYLDRETIKMLRIPDEVVKKIVDKKLKEVNERVKRFTGGFSHPEIKGKTFILVDDGVATGATMKAAIEVLRQKQPKSLVVAIPVSPPSTVLELRDMADEVVCLYEDGGFMAVGQYYSDFAQVEDDEVVQILKKFRAKK
jgi:putative phosphoribosyl transferase